MNKVKKLKFFSICFSALLLSTMTFSVSASASVTGDINGDGTRNISDLALIRRFLNGKSSIVNPDDADIDNSGSVTTVDAVDLQKMLIGINVDTGTDSNLVTEDINTKENYIKFNAKTGVQTSKYTLDSLAKPLVVKKIPKNIQDPDTRYKDYSKSGIIQIFTNKGYGTAFIVDKHTVATAAHCVAGGAIVSKLQLFNSDGSKGIFATPVEYHIPENYYTTVNNNHVKYDYALITVEEELTDYQCFSLGMPLESISGKDLKITGFPSDKSSEETTSPGKAIQIADYTLRYDNDIEPGNSGGPVYITENLDGREYNSVVAISTIKGGTFNFGTRVTSNLLHFYLNNPNISF